MPIALSRDPLVSVGIITYNQVEFLEELVDSVFAQDYPNIEVFVADDASTDGTQALCERYRKELGGKFRYESAATNRGVTENSNVVLRSCCGSYVCLVGGDDIFMPGKVSSQVKWMEEHPTAALCACAVEVFDSSSGATLAITHDRVLSGGGGVAKLIRQACATPTSAFMFRRSAISGLRFDSRTPVVSDWLFIVEACGRGGCGYIDKVLLRYRRHGGNVTAFGASKSYMDDRLIYTDIYLARYGQHYLALRKQRANILYQHGKRCGYSGDRRNAFHFAIYAILEWPFTLAPWVALALATLAYTGLDPWDGARRCWHGLRRVRGETFRK